MKIKIFCRCSLFTSWSGCAFGNKLLFWALTILKTDQQTRYCTLCKSNLNPPVSGLLCVLHYTYLNTEKRKFIERNRSSSFPTPYLVRINFQPQAAERTLQVKLGVKRTSGCFLPKTGPPKTIHSYWQLSHELHDTQVQATTRKPIAPIFKDQRNLQVHKCSEPGQQDDQIFYGAAQNFWILCMERAFCHFHGT